MCWGEKKKERKTSFGEEEKALRCPTPTKSQGGERRYPFSLCHPEKKGKIRLCVVALNVGGEGVDESFSPEVLWVEFFFVRLEKGGKGREVREGLYQTESPGNIVHNV